MKSPVNNFTCILLLMVTTCAAMAFAADASAEVAVSVVHVFHHDPNSTEGAWPGPAVALPDGTLYGTTEKGGMDDAGTVFAIHQDGQLVTLQSFGGPQGSYPDPCMVSGADGSIYGTIGTTGLGAYSGAEYVFRVGSDGKVATVAKIFPPAAKGDDWSALVPGSDGRIYALANRNSSEFGVVAQADGDAPSPAFQLVHRNVGSDASLFLNGQSRESEAAQATKDVERADATPSSNGRLQNAAIQCGETVITPDGHAWSPTMNHTHVRRSVTTNSSDGYYEPVPQYLGKSGVNTLIDNPLYPEAASAFGRFADAPHDSIWATTKRQASGSDAVPYEVIEVSPLGQVARRISLDILGIGFSPFGGLVNDPDGYVYGLARGAANNGTVLLYRFSPDQGSSGGAVEVVYRFTDTNGPLTLWTDLTAGGDGNLYVTFPEGGKYKQGIIYRVKIGASHQ
jgi:uncharacterized repeat protein (TIGR03803 family)